MTTRRTRPGNALAVSSAPLARPAPRGPGCIPRQAIAIVRPLPQGLSWGMIGTGVALGVLFITGLSLAGLALRPRDPEAALSSFPVQTAQVTPLPAPVVVPPAQPPVLVPVVKIEVQVPAPPEKPASPPPVAPAPPVAAPAAPPEVAAAPAAPEAPDESTPAASGTCGTTVNFLASTQAAARQAATEGKLVFTLHVSGNFEDPGFT